MNIIENKAVVNIQACDKTIEVTSNQTTTRPIKLRIEKKQDCDIVLVGEDIKYTVEIENLCSTDIENLTFKDELHDCFEYVDESFRVDGETRTPEFQGNTLYYKIDELKSCEIITITFEVAVTDNCCDCAIERSAQPIINQPHYNDDFVHGTGVPHATIYVEFPGGETKTTTVNNGGNWSIDAPYRLEIGQTVSAWQVEPGKKPSEPVTKIVV